MAVTLVQPLRNANLYTSTTNPTTDTSFESVSDYPKGTQVIYSNNTYVRTASTSSLSDWVLASSGTLSVGYLEYECILTRTGASTFTETVLKNTTGATVTWTDDSNPGVYVGTFSSAVLDTADTSAYIGGRDRDIRYYLVVDTTTQVSIFTVLYNAAVASEEGAINNTYIHIKIY